MKEGQDKIYYITADSFGAARSSPHLEIFRKKGVEVLLMYDRVDEWVMAHLTEFEGKELQSVAKGDLDLGKLRGRGGEEGAGEGGRRVQGADRQDREGARREGQGSARHASPHRLARVPGRGPVGMSTNLERLLKAAGQKVPGSKPILEVNPHHPLVRALKHESDEKRFADWSHILFDQAVLAEGGQLDDPGTFVKRLNELMLALAGARGRRSGRRGTNLNLAAPSGSTRWFGNGRIAVTRKA